MVIDACVKCGLLLADSCFYSMSMAFFAVDLLLLNVVKFGCLIDLLKKASLQRYLNFVQVSFEWYDKISKCFWVQKIYIGSYFTECRMTFDLWCRWKGSGSSVNDAPADRHESRHSKEAAWEEINTLKQKIREFSTRNPLISPSTRSVEKRGTHLSTPTASRVPSTYGRWILWLGCWPLVL